MQTVKFIYDTGSTTENTIVIKDLSIDWEQELWGADEISITGKRRNRMRSYKPRITIEFEHNDQLRTVSKEIYDTLQTGEVFLETDNYYFSVVPDSFTSEHRYQGQIRRKPSSMMLVGDLQNISEPALKPAILSLSATAGDTEIELCYEVDDFLPMRRIAVSGSVANTGQAQTLVEATPGEYSISVLGSVANTGTVSTTTLGVDTISVSGSVANTGSVTTNAEIAIDYGDVPTVCKTGTGLRVEWAADAGADNYNLQRRVDSGSWVTISTGFIGTTYNDAYPASVPTSSIEYRVSACTEFGCGAYGDPSISTTYNSALSC